MGVRCIVENCRTFINLESKGPQSKRNNYYTFPKDAKMRQVWLKKCGKKEPIDYEHSYVCVKHFKDEDFERNLRNELLDVPIKKKLKSDAIPSLNLNDNDKEDDSGRNSGRKQRYEQRERKKEDDSPKKNKPTKRAVDVDLTLSPVNRETLPLPKKMKSLTKDSPKASSKEEQEKLDEIDAAELQKLLNIIIERIQCLEQEVEGLNHIMEDIKSRIEKMQNRH